MQPAEHGSRTVLDARFGYRAFENGDLMSERRVLQRELRLVSNRKMEELNQDAKVGHPSILTEASIDEQVEKC